MNHNLKITLLSLLFAFNYLHVVNCSVGDEELAQAFECGLLDMQSVIRAQLANTNNGFVPIQDCFMNPSFYKYPQQTPMGSLFDMLVRGVFTVAIRKNEPYKTEIGIILNTTIEKIADKYKYPKVQLEFREIDQGVESSAKMMNLLFQSSVDMIFPGIETSTHFPAGLEIRRACSTHAVGFRIASRDEKINSLTTLKQAVFLSPAPKIVVSNLAESIILMERFGLSSKVIDGDDTSRLNFLKANSEFVAMIRHTPKTVAEEKAEGLTTFDLGFQAPLPFFFRREMTNDAEEHPREVDFGNTNLMTAIDAGIFIEQKNPVEYSWNDPLLGVSGDCLLLKPEFPHRSSLKSGVLYDILQKGIIKLGYVREYSAPLVVTAPKDESYFHVPEGVNPFGNLSLPSKENVKLKTLAGGSFGRLPDLEIRLIKRISDYYHTPIQIQQYLYTSSEDVFEALQLGVIDATSMTFNLGSEYDSSPRRWNFLYSCTGCSYKLSFFLPISSFNAGVKSFQDFENLITNIDPSKGKKTIIVANRRILTVAMELLFEPFFTKGKFHSVELKVIENPAESFDELIKDPNVIAFLPKYLGGVPQAFQNQVYLIPAKHSVPVGMFFRRDKSAEVVDDEEDEKEDAISTLKSGTTAGKASWIVLGFILIAAMIVAYGLYVAGSRHKYEKMLAQQNIIDEEIVDYQDESREKEIEKEAEKKKIATERRQKNAGSKNE